MLSATNSVLESLIGVLSAVHTTADTVYWYRIYDNPKDDPEHPQYFDEAGNSTLLAAEKEEMMNLNKMSLMDPEPDEAEPEEQEEPDPEPVVTELPKFLSCASATAKGLEDAEGIKSIDLEYDYEIRTTEGADLFALVNKYELDLLKAVADQFSLTSCEIVRRSLRKERRKLAGDSSVVAVGSEPEDTEDSVHSECTSCDYTGGAMLGTGLAYFSHRLYVVVSS